MAIAEMFFWWYSHGWKIFTEKVRTWFSSITDFFSMSSLLRTLFNPYRQISAGSASSDASLDTKFHMFLDNLISRSIGFASRLIILIAGTIVITLGGILSILVIILWPFVPLLPIAGIILSVSGVTL